MKICVLVDSYIKNETMNGAIACALIENWEKQGIEIVVIRLDKEESKENNIYSVKSFNLYLENIIKKKIDKKKKNYGKVFYI